MSANLTQQTKNGQGSAVFCAEGAGLVPYTTSQKTAELQACRDLESVSRLGPSASLELSKLVLVSREAARLARLKHHVRTACRIIREGLDRAAGLPGSFRMRAVFVTLTYRAGVESKPKDVAAYLDHVRKWGKAHGCTVPYVWVAEMQKRGAVHYHLILWVPMRLRLPRPDKRRKPWWPHGSSNVQTVKANAAGYLMKYVSKGVGGGYPDLPQGARICGSGGLDRYGRDDFHYWRLPRYVRENVQIGERCRRCVGGGWFSTVTGERWRSDWGLNGIALKSRGVDCNGRKLRPDAVVMLSDEYKAVAGGVDVDLALTWDVLREVWDEQAQAAQVARLIQIEETADYQTRTAFLSLYDDQSAWAY